MAKSKVFVDKAKIEDLLGLIDGYAVAAEDLHTYLQIYVCNERDREALASVPWLARQWETLSKWRMDEARKLAKVLHATADRVATAASYHLDTDIEIAARFPDGITDDDNPISKKLKAKAEEKDGAPVGPTRWAEDPHPEPAVDPTADYSPYPGRMPDHE